MVLSAISPDSNSTRITYVQALLEELRKKTPTHIIWVVCQPDHTTSSETNHESIHSIHRYKNGLDLIKQHTPDVILLNSGIEVLQYSASIAADFLHIPMVGFSVSKIDSSQYLLPGSYNLSKRIFSTTVPTDSPDQKKFLRRGKFMLYKLLFSIRTKCAIHYSFHKIFKDFFTDLYIYSFNKSLPRNKLLNLHFIHQESQIPILVELGLSKDKLLVIGSILMDKIYQNSLNRTTKISQSNKIKILIITDSLFEHGIWTSKQRDTFLRDLFLKLKNESNISFSLKIHPVNESFVYYEKLLDELQIKTTIYQSENLWSVISNFDMVISYGYSTAHTEIAFSEMKMILLNDGVNLSRFPLVEESIDSGHIQYCSTLKNLIPTINSFFKSILSPSEKFIKKRNDLFSKFDGKSAERGATAILSLIKNKKTGNN